jgi:N-acetylmuramoyl-L-alanine amidase
MTHLNKAFFLALTCLLLAVFAAPVEAVSPQEKYHAAERCYKKLKAGPGKMKYRDNWLSCIDKFVSVYRADPSGKWAAAGLYRAGVLYHELYRRSRNTTYRAEARDMFSRIAKRFPKSGYRKKALERLKSYSRQEKKNGQSAARRKRLEAQYDRAQSCYQRLRKTPKKMRYRDSWFKCVNAFRAVYEKDPDGPLAPACLYMSGILYQGLYRYSKNMSDKNAAADIFKSVIARFPKSDYKNKARQAMTAFLSGAPAPRKAKKKVKKPPPSKPEPVAVAEKKKGAFKDHSVITGLKVWSDKRHTRIVIYADKETAYDHRILKKDPSFKKPPRLYVDFKKSRLKKDAEKSIHVDDKLLVDVRSGQFTPDTVRIVSDIKFFKSYSIFSLKNPFRTVIDVRGEPPAALASLDKKKDKKKGKKVAAPAKIKKRKKNASAKPAGKKGKKQEKISPGAIARQLALGVSRIVIDPGHGGRDVGASGYYKGVFEKNLTLAIAKRLAKKIKQQLGCEVILTRSRDRGLSLEERTAIANTKNADLFISLHTNAHKDKRAHGIETYILNFATDDDAITVAARENATTEKNISDLQTILNDLMRNTKVDESIRLAGYVQNALVRRLKAKYSRVKNKGIKQAPFYVLMGARMPAILIETSFISNRRECKRLMTREYQERLCDGIVKGIREYVKDTKPSALLKRPSPEA